MKFSGFTLMELMIVIAIVGILVAIAIPSYRVYTRRAHYTEIVQAAAPYKIGVEECFQVTSNLEDCRAGENGVPPAISKGQGTGLIDEITIDHGVIKITPKNKYGIKTKDTYVLTPKIVRDVILWSTGGGAVASGYVN